METRLASIDFLAELQKTGEAHGFKPSVTNLSIVPHSLLGIQPQVLLHTVYIKLLVLVKSLKRTRAYSIYACILDYALL